MAFGLRLARVSGQGENQGGIQEYNVDPANATAIFNGDPVRLSGGYIVKAAAGEDIIGVFAGCHYVDQDGSYTFKSYWPGAAAAGASDVKASVAGGEGSRFYIELDATEGAADRAMVGTRRDIVDNGGSTVYGDSGVALGAASATGALFVNQLADLPGNDFGKSGVIFEVTVASPQKYT